MNRRDDHFPAALGPRKTLGPSLMLVVGILGISTASLWARGSSAGGAELAFRRLILTVPILWLIARSRARGEPVDSLARGAPWVLLSGISLAVHFSAYFASLARLESVAVTLVFVSLHPVLLFTIEGLFPPVRGAARSGLRLWQLTGVLLAVGGSVGLAWDESLRDDGDPIGIAYGCLSAVGMVGYLLAGRRASRLLPATIYARRSYTVAAIILAMGVIASGGTLVPENGLEWRIALLLAFFPTVLGHTPMNAALNHLPATVVSTAFLGEVVGASILVWVFLGEVPPDGFWIFGSAIAAGVLVVSWPSRRGNTGPGKTPLAR